MKNRIAILLALVLATLEVGCGNAGAQRPVPPPRPMVNPWTSDPIPPGRIQHEAALKIAREKVRTDIAAYKKQNVALEVDTARYFSKYDGKTDTYFFDFPWSGQVPSMPFRWEAGFKVAVKAKDGSVREANAYER